MKVIKNVNNVIIVMILFKGLDLSLNVEISIGMI